VKHATVADIARLEGVSPEQAVERAAHLQPTTDDDDDAAGDLAFAEFDIVGVLERAAPLLAAKSGDEELFGGADDDKDDAKKQLSKAERLRLAKQTLKQRLGMALDSTLEGAAEDEDGGKTKRAEKSSDGGDDAGQNSVKANLDVDKFVDVDDLVGEEDVDEVKVEPRDDAEKKMDASDLTQLSARERNRLKRKMKRGARDAADGVEPAAKRGRKPGSGSSREGRLAEIRSTPRPPLDSPLRRRKRRMRLPRSRLEGGRWRGPARNSRTRSSRRAGRRGTAPPPRCARCSARTPPRRLCLGPPRARAASSRIPRRRLRAKTPPGSRMLPCACSAFCLSTDSGITWATASSRPCAKPARKRWARVCCLSRRRLSRRSSDASWCCSGGRSGR
jgi:hypothetical protein